MSKVGFDTELVRERNATRLWVPAESAQVFGGERLLPAVVTINGTPVRTTLHTMNGGECRRPRRLRPSVVSMRRPETRARRIEQALRALG